MEKEFVLGVDGGATKTEAAVANLNGKIIGRGISGPSSIRDYSPKEISKNIKSAVIIALKKAKLPKSTKFSSICFGGARIDSDKDLGLAKKVIGKAIKPYSNGSITIVNDIRIVLRNGTDKNFGVAAIAGTGSNYYGIDKKGKEFMAAGLGHILADEGSGYLIGSKILRAAVRSSDGRGPKTVLEDLVKKNFKIKNIRELEHIVYSGHFGKNDTAALTPLIDKALKKKDEVAIKIIEGTINEIVVGIIDVIENLNMKKEEFDVVCSGGVFKTIYPIKELVEKKVLTAAPKAKVVFPKDKPVMGAVKMAIDNLKD